MGRDSFRKVHDDAIVERTLRLLNAHVVHRNKLIDGYLSPVGLRRLGLRDSLAVMVRVARPKEALDLLTKQVSRLAQKKCCDLALVVARDDSRAEVVTSPVAPSGTLWEEKRLGCDSPKSVLIVPAPSREHDVRAIRRLLRTHAESLTTLDEVHQTP